MNIKINRLNDNTLSTIGTLHVDNVFECFTLEDTHNVPKIYGKTRIPSGKYRLKLRTGSPMAIKYANRYTWHRGMLWLQNVPGFEYVYIHTGNNEEHTDGCILVGKTCSCMIGNQHLSGSKIAYKDLYEIVIKAMDDGEEVTLEIE